MTRYRVVVVSPLGDEDSHEFLTLPTAMKRAEELVTLGSQVTITATRERELVPCDV